MNVQLKDDNGKVLFTIHSRKIRVQKNKTDVSILITDGEV